VTVVTAPADHHALIAALREVTHETRGAVGTIRLAMTTLLEDGIDEATRVELVKAADTEALRLVAELAALPALVAALVDDAPPAPVDLSAALRRINRDLSGLGVAVRARGRTPLVVLGDANFEAVLAALVRVSIAAGATEVSARVVDGAIEVRFAGAVRRGPLVGHLTAVLNASPLELDGFAIRFPRVTA
jgi:hypothetical protein